MEEKDNIIRIIRETIKAIKNNDSYGLKILSDQTNNTVSRTQDPDNITIAVLVYSLGKLIERKQYHEIKGWKKFYDEVLRTLNMLEKSLSSQNTPETRRLMKKLRKTIYGINGDLKKYIQEVFRKASINKASKVYNHGISMERTSKLLGITMYEMANYIGQKNASEKEEPSNVSNRIKLIEEIFS